MPVRDGRPLFPRFEGLQEIIGARMERSSRLGRHQPGRRVNLCKRHARKRFSGVLPFKRFGFRRSPSDGGDTLREFKSHRGCHLVISFYDYAVWHAPRVLVQIVCQRADELLHEQR